MNIIDREAFSESVTSGLQAVRANNANIATIGEATLLVAEAIGKEASTITSWRGGRCPASLDDPNVLGFAWTILTKGRLGLEWLTAFLSTTTYPVLPNPSREWFLACFSHAHVAQGDPLQIITLMEAAIDDLAARLFPPDQLQPEQQIAPVETNGRGDVWVVPEQSAADADLRAYIDSTKSTLRTVFMIQYTLVNVDRVLGYLKAIPDCKLFLLVKHPGIGTKNPNLDTISIYQRDKICNQIGSMLGLERTLYHDALHIKFYSFPAAMRAVYLGRPGMELANAIADVGYLPLNDAQPTSGFISMSMYRYVEKEGGVRSGVIGATNPHVHAHTDSASGRILHSFFEKAFKALWENGTLAVDLFDAIQRHLERLNSRV